MAATSSTVMLIIGAILLAAATVSIFFPRIPAVIPGYVGMLILSLGDCIYVTNSSLIFWGAASVLVVINHYLLPPPIRSTGVGVGYISGGALAGLMVGLTLYNQASLVGGAVLGAVLGAIAFSRTASGRVLGFPSLKFFNYLGAKGIPPVVTLSMVGIALASLIAGKTIFG